MAPVLMIVIFVLGYLAIAFEHNLKVNKAAPALITGILCWTVYILQGGHGVEEVNEQLLHHLGEIASILFFLMGAMTIVELIDHHDGFDIITERIRTKSKTKLLLIVTILTFFLSALLDNLTTSIVMVSLCAKIFKEKEDRLWFASMVIIAANTGGVWSPLGDVTTTMLWIGGQITAVNIVKILLIPSLVGCIIPFYIISWRFRNKYVDEMPRFTSTPKERRDGQIVLIFGILSLIFVPVFKIVTHLPPFTGMMLSLGFMWIVTTLIHKKYESRPDQRLTKALSSIDTPSILFFLG
ncbi:MAG: sodium:proton antiporter NhaD, partial [Niabella sp.]